MVTAVVHHGLCAQFARKMLKGERNIKVGSEIIVDLHLGIARTIILRVRINAEVAVIIVQIAIERNFVKPQIKSKTCVGHMTRRLSRKIVSIPSASTIHTALRQTVTDVESGLCLRKMSHVFIGICINAVVGKSVLLNHVGYPLVISSRRQIQVAAIVGIA